MGDAEKEVGSEEVTVELPLSETCASITAKLQVRPLEGRRVWPPRNKASVAMPGPLRLCLGRPASLCDDVPRAPMVSRTCRYLASLIYSTFLRVMELR